MTAFARTPRHDARASGEASRPTRQGAAVANAAAVAAAKAAGKAKEIRAVVLLLLCWRGWVESGGAFINTEFRCSHCGRRLLARSRRVGATQAAGVRSCVGMPSLALITCLCGPTLARPRVAHDCRRVRGLKSSRRRIVPARCGKTRTRRAGGGAAPEAHPAASSGEQRRAATSGRDRPRAAASSGEQRGPAIIRAYAKVIGLTRLPNAHSPLLRHLSAQGGGRRASWLRPPVQVERHDALS